MDRRRFLKSAVFACLTALSVPTAEAAIDHLNMLRRPRACNGYIPVDTHSHPAKVNLSSEKEKYEFADSIMGRIVALCERYGVRSIMSYEDTLALADGKTVPGLTAKEINKGVFARLTWEQGNEEPREGYIIKAQEVATGPEGKCPHIVALGIEGKLIHDYDNPDKTIREIREREGFSILAHPLVYIRNGKIRPKILEGDERKSTLEFMLKTDAVETHNGMAINLIPGIAWLSEANDEIKRIVKKYPGLSEVSASDCHMLYSQICAAATSIRNTKDLHLNYIFRELKGGAVKQYTGRISKISCMEYFALKAAGVFSY